MTEAHTPSHPQPSAALLKGKKRSGGPSWSILLAIMFLLIALITAGGAWFQQQRFEKTAREVATQVQGLINQLNEARRDSNQALSLAQSHVTRIAQLEQAQTEAKSQYAALEQLWVGTNKGMEDVMLANDIDRLLTTANQQLRLSANVNNAIVTLESANALLERADRSKFAGVQRAISLDLERLRAVPLVDVAQLSSRLDVLSGLLSRAPLILPDAVAPTVAVGTSPESPPSPSLPASPDAKAHAQPKLEPSSAPLASTPQAWWQVAFDRSLDWTKSAAAVVVREFADVVNIQRVSDANALLMSPEQGALLRANLRARVLTAQMALLMNQESVWKAELGHIQQSLNTRYEARSPDTVAALRLVQELAKTQIGVPLPDIKGSVAALESVRSSEPESTTGGQ